MIRKDDFFNVLLKIIVLSCENCYLFIKKLNQELV